MRGSRNQRANNILDAITQLSGGDAAEGRAPMRMKIMVRKEDLKQVLEVIRDGRALGCRGSVSTAEAAASLEQRLNLMRRRHILRSASRRSGPGSWRPVLQSIPEEL